MELLLSSSHSSQDGHGNKYGCVLSDYHVERCETLAIEDAALADEMNVIQREFANLDEQREELKSKLNDVQAQRRHVRRCIRQIETMGSVLPPKEGPLDWMDSSSFKCGCMLVVVANVICMANEGQISSSSATILNSLFLVFYWSEFVLGMLHHKFDYIFGPLAAVWWHWLDLAIVCCGTIELLTPCSEHCYLLHSLRLFRLLRLAKVMKWLLLTDFHGLKDHQYFTAFTTCVICCNAIVLSWELDYDWDGWVVVNHLFLVIYVFEMVVRLRVWGFEFFYHSEEWSWNWLDFIIVTAGVIDLWFIPAMGIVEHELLGMQAHVQSGGVREIMAFMRLTRMTRVLRLIRIVRSVPPLYKLLRGIVNAMSGMKWVIFVAVLTLYAGAIVFTYLVGKGLMYEDGDVPDAAAHAFGTVTRSMFSLFELMNGDMDVVMPILDQPIGKVLFLAFMVIANWSILAILTSVVSEGMIRTSTRIAAEELKELEEQAALQHLEYLISLFKTRDPKGTGHINLGSWIEMIQDEEVFGHLHACTQLTTAELIDLFKCLAVEEDFEGVSLGEDMVDYHSLVKNFGHSNMPADKRSLAHIMMRILLVQKEVSTISNKVKQDHADLQLNSDWIQRHQSVPPIAGYVSESKQCLKGTTTSTRSSPRPSPRGERVAL